MDGMTGSAVHPFQKAVYNALASDGDFMASVQDRWYDDIPENPTMPYADVGFVTTTFFGTHGKKGEEVTIHLHAWSDKKGFLEAQEIIGHMLRVLGFLPTMEIPGWCVMGLYFDSAEYIRQEDGGKVLRQGHVQFRAPILPAN